MKRYRYVSLEELRRDYKVQNEVSDEILLNLIETSSRIINHITSQIFDVYRETIKKIPSSFIFHQENLIPILEINSFKRTSNKYIGGGSIDGVTPLDWISLFGSSSSFEIDNRYYELIEDNGYIKLLLEINSQVELDAYFGKILKEDEKTEYILTSEITPRSTKIYLDSIDGLYKGKSLIINDTLRVIVNDARDNYILVDKTYNDKTILSDKKAYSFGYIYPDIKRACALLVLDRLSDDVIDSDSVINSGNFSPLRSEKTDNYQYEYQRIGNTSDSGLILGKTGNIEVDNILENYMPPSVAFWV